MFPFISSLHLSQVAVAQLFQLGCLTNNTDSHSISESMLSNFGDMGSLSGLQDQTVVKLAQDLVRDASLPGVSLSCTRMLIVRRSCPRLDDALQRSENVSKHCSVKLFGCFIRLRVLISFFND